MRTASWISAWRDNSSAFQLPLPLEYANLTWLGGISSYPTCCPLVRFSLSKGASKMLRATGHARMVK